MLGACVGRSRRRDLQFWASQLFDLALPTITETTSPRAWAFGLIGVCLYLERFSGARPASQVRDTLTERLIECLEKTSTDEWPWFEDVLSYDNAKLPHALIASGRSGGDSRAGSSGSAIARAGWSNSKNRRPAISGRSVPTAFISAIATGPIRPTADRGQLHRLGLHRGLPRHRRPSLAAGGPAGVRVVLGRQRPGARSLRRQDRRLLRRSARRPPQHEPGGRVDPGVSAGTGRDETAGKHAGDFPPGAGQLSGPVLVQDLCFS